MVKKMNHCFKNILTVSTVFRSVVIEGDHAIYGDKIRFSMHF